MWCFRHLFRLLLLVYKINFQSMQHLLWAYCNVFWFWIIFQTFLAPNKARLIAVSLAAAAFPWSGSISHGFMGNGTGGAIGLFVACCWEPDLNPRAVGRCSCDECGEAPGTGLAVPGRTTPCDWDCCDDSGVLAWDWDVVCWRDVTSPSQVSETRVETVPSKNASNGSDERVGSVLAKVARCSSVNESFVITAISIRLLRISGNDLKNVFLMAEHTTARKSKADDLDKVVDVGRQWIRERLSEISIQILKDLCLW